MGSKGGGLNIIPGKSWNVYGREQRERVRRDEEAAAAKERADRERELRRQQAERRQALLDRARRAGQASSSRDAGGDPPAAPVPLRDARLGALPLQEQRRRLPIARVRDELLYLVQNHGTVIVVGHTGCGKTTQIPQYLLEAGWVDGARGVVCTQPRRIAAVTVARRVAEEVGTGLGERVGYGVRFDQRATPGVTSVKFCTDGTLLREMMDDPLLSKYGVVMVDEAHERTTATDILLGLLKKVRRRRPDLRLIIASATLDAEAFAAFFGAGPAAPATGPVPADPPRGPGDRAPPPPPDPAPAIVSVEGRTHPVDVFYRREAVADYVRTAAETALEIHRTEGPGDVLVFLTSQEEVQAAVDLLARAAEQQAAHRGVVALPLYADLPAHLQQRVFHAVPRGGRKVVVATNVAETSVTLEGVVFVVDCCFVKTAAFDPRTGLEALLVVPVSKASAAQRAGRAGRVRPGKCYRLCTEADFLARLPAASRPQIQQAELSHVVLQLKALGVDNIMNFDWLAPPSSEAMVRALEQLYALGGLGDDARLTSPLGAHLAELPVPPMLGKALLVAGELGCAEELLTIAALLSVKSVWAAHAGNRQAVRAAKEVFAVGEGDLVTYLNVYAGFRDAGFSARWCREHHLHAGALQKARGIRAQLAAVLRRFGVPSASAGRDMEPVQRALACGFAANAAARAGAADGRAVYKALRGPATFRIGSGSVLHGHEPEAVVFHRAAFHGPGAFEMRLVTPIKIGWLPELAPRLYKKRGGEGGA